VNQANFSTMKWMLDFFDRSYADMHADVPSSFGQSTSTSVVAVVLATVFSILGVVVVGVGGWWTYRRYRSTRGTQKDALDCSAIADAGSSSSRRGPG
jgi:hypothetical protein